MTAGLIELSWVGRQELLIVWLVEAVIYLGLAIAFWRQWPSVPSKWLCIAMLVAFVAMIFNDYPRYFGYALPEALYWLQASLAGAGTMANWLFVLSLTTPHFRFRWWHLTLTGVALVARLATSCDHLAVMQGSANQVEPGLLLEAAYLVDWVSWQVGVIAPLCVLILAGPAVMAAPQRRAWSLLLIANIYEVGVLGLGRIFFPDFWPISVVFLYVVGTLAVWGPAFLYLLRRPGLRLRPQAAGPGLAAARF